MNGLSENEIFILIPKIMIWKDSQPFFEKRKNKSITATEILKIIGLGTTWRNYKMLEKWSSPPYYFLKRVREKKPYRYMIKDNNFWDWFWKHQPSMNVINYLKTKATIIE